VGIGLNADLTKTVLETAQSLGQPSVSELVDSLVKEKGFKLKDATRAVYIEWKRGTLDLSETNPPSTVAGYLFNVESLWFWGVTGLVAVTMLVVFTVDASWLLYARYVLGGIFVLFLPGYMLISVLYSRNEDLSGLERAALSIGLSLAITPLVGLALNFTPWGIRLEPIMIALALFAEIMAAVVVVRRFRYFQLSHR
jgi:hypothetical protein